MMKVVLGSIGKYIDESGAESVLVQNQVFGKAVVNSVLGGTHYVRSLKGILLPSECIEILQWPEFFKVNSLQAYSKNLQMLKVLKNADSKKDKEHSQQ